MPPTPLYSAAELQPIYNLLYNWTAYPYADRNWEPDQLETAIRDCVEVWGEDGMQLLSPRAQRRQLDCLFRCSPMLSPVAVCRLAKGRLQHALRERGMPIRFSRKISFRGIGANTTETIKNYIRGQVEKEDFVDPRFAKKMAEYTVCDLDVDQLSPTETRRGRYWYNLHLVLVTDGRYRFQRNEILGRLRQACRRIGEKRGCPVADVSVMLDHIHLSLKGNVQMSPTDILLCFLNNLAYVLGQNRIWSTRVYVGAFSEYTVGAIKPRR